MATPTISNTYVGDGSTVLYSFTFPYIEVPDVKVALDEVETTEYIFANATTIQFNTAPALGVAINIFRDTDDTDLKAVFFPGSAIRARDLNDNFTQTLYVVQEAGFQALSAGDDAKDALAAAEAAQVSAGLAASSASEAASNAVAAEAAAQSALDVANNIDADIEGLAEDVEQAQQDAASAAADAEAAQVAAANAEASAKAVEDAVLDGGVVSVNGQSGVVSLNVSDLPNDANYITAAEAPSSIDDLTDVDTSSADHIPTDGQSLVWNQAMGHWMPSDASLIIGSLPTLP
jgi:hypothetical protein